MALYIILMDSGREGETVLGATSDASKVPGMVEKANEESSFLDTVEVKVFEDGEVFTNYMNREEALKGRQVSQK